MADAKKSDAAGLFTASQVARFCQVDLKTIHNWAERGTVRHFRTPGRHLRFRKEDVLDFLRRYGYPIPEALRPNRPRVFAVVANENRAEAIRSSLAPWFEVTLHTEPFDALIAVGAGAPDAMILDMELPSIDVTRCIARLRAVPETAHVRCVALSQGSGARREALVAGAYDALDADDLLGLGPSLGRLLGVVPD